MNRTDILKKCVERGVAGQGEIEAVSHLFYVYLLSALQRGQRVEVPRFGTFGTKVVGIRKVRKIPYFEPERDLARKVNERFEHLKYVVTGRYEPLLVAPAAEYRGREVPYDAVADQQDKDRVLDAYTDVSISQYQSLSEESIQPSQEERIMPRLNLKDDSGSEMDQTPYEDENQTAPPLPTLRDVDSAGGSKATPILIGVIVLLLLALGVYALNYFNVVHLWGKKPVRVVQSETFPEQQAPTDSAALAQASGQTPTPGALPGTTPSPSKGTVSKGNATKGNASKAAATKSAQPKPVPSTSVQANTSPSSGSGTYTIQLSSWASKRKADAEASRLASAGFDAYVVNADVQGTTWYRVRVGRYNTQAEAKAEITKLAEGSETQAWIARIGG